MKKLLMIVLLLFASAQLEAHDIDNLSKFLNAFWHKDELKYRVNKNEPHHCADGLCEGRYLNKCLTYPQVNGQLRTLKEINKNFWHWRRVLIAVIQLLSGETNLARGLTGNKKPIPFINYDPFYDGKDPHFPKVFASFKAKTGQDPYSSLEVRYDLFSIPHVQLVGTKENTLLAFKKCKDATHRERMHAPECQGGDRNMITLVGGDSYKAPSPFRDEDAFVYYDRIPASPIDDACFGWIENKLTFRFVLEYAQAHEEAGKSHVKEVFKRLLYIRMVIQSLS